MKFFKILYFRGNRAEHIKNFSCVYRKIIVIYWEEGIAYYFMNVQKEVMYEGMRKKTGQMGCDFHNTILDGNTVWIKQWVGGTSRGKSISDAGDRICL